MSIKKTTSKESRDYSDRQSIRDTATKYFNDMLGYNQTIRLISDIKDRNPSVTDTADLKIKEIKEIEEIK